MSAVSNGRAFRYHLMGGNDVGVTSASAIRRACDSEMDHSISKPALVQEIQLYAHIAGQNLLAAGGPGSGCADPPRVGGGEHSTQRGLAAYLEPQV
jgi:hypothetical protein